jgi:thiol-disulfide isomerase/thioredoxin
MGKASRTKQAPDRRARIAAQREAARRAEQRKRIYLAGGSILAVIIVVIALVLVNLNKSPGSPSVGSSGPTGSALTAVVNQTTSVPAATLDTVGSGSGSVLSPPITVKPAQSPLTSGGKPEMLYVGAEYCPYCAAERWAMVVALSRFGTFSGLATTHSAAADGAGNAEPYPNTSTWTFAHAKYTSPYLTFDPVEWYTNVPDSSNGGYTTLQTPTAAQQALFTKYDSGTYVPGLTQPGAFPFIDFGNKYLVVGASYNAGVLSGKTWAQIAAALKDPSSSIAKAVDGTANYITAAICGMTGNQPASACTPAVKSLESKI